MTDTSTHCHGYEIVCPDGAVRAHPYHGEMPAMAHAYRSSQPGACTNDDPAHAAWQNPPCPQGPHTIRPATFDHDESVEAFLEGVRVRHSAEPSDDPSQSPEDVVTVIREAIGRKSIVTLDGDGAGWIGFPLAVSDNLVLIAHVGEFHPDGFDIVSMEAIYGARVSDGNTFATRVLAEEGIERPLTGHVHTHTFHTALIAIQKHYAYAGVVTFEGDEYVGKIVGVSDHDVSMTLIFADGTRDDEVGEIEFADIQSVNFGSEYLRMYAKHATPADDAPDGGMH